LRRKIQAGAGVENLRLRCPYFYDVALLLHSMERGPPLAEFAMKTFQARYKVNSLLITLTDYHLSALINGASACRIERPLLLLARDSLRLSCSMHKHRFWLLSIFWRLLMQQQHWVLHN